MIEFMALVLAISGLLVGLCAAGVVVALVSAAVWHCFPSCALSRWLKAEVIQEVDVSSIEIGACLKPNPARKGGSARNGDIMVGGVMCDE